MSYVKFVSINYKLRQYLRFSRKVFRARENVSSYVTLQKESNQTVAVYHELFSALFLPGPIP